MLCSDSGGELVTRMSQFKNLRYTSIQVGADSDNIFEKQQELGGRRGNLYLVHAALELSFRLAPNVFTWNQLVSFLLYLLPS